MLFRKKIEKSCAYCVLAARMDEDTMVCKRKGPVSVDGACRWFRYDPLKRVPEHFEAELPKVDAEADYSL